MRRTLAALVVTCALAAGCVSQKEFLAKSQEADHAAASLAAERQRAAELQGQLGQLQRALADAQHELAMTRQALGETKEALAERERKLAEATVTYDKLVADLKGEIAEGQVKITRLRDKLTVNLVDKILFDSGSTTIGPRGQEVLRKVAEVLKTAKNKQIQIEGHTDNVPVGGALKTRFPTNWELSVVRATVVARFLQEQGGIAPVMLAATGYGEHHPVTSNESPEGRAENRRIEIVLLPVASEVATR
jgi:chemotaxis protein MotB